MVRLDTPWSSIAERGKWRRGPTVPVATIDALDDFRRDYAAAPLRILGNAMFTDTEPLIVEGVSRVQNSALSRVLAEQLPRLHGYLLVFGFCPIVFSTAGTLLTLEPRVPDPATYGVELWSSPDNTAHALRLRIRRHMAEYAGFGADAMLGEYDDSAVFVVDTLPHPATGAMRARLTHAYQWSSLAESALLLSERADQLNADPALITQVGDGRGTGTRNLMTAADIRAYAASAQPNATLAAQLDRDDGALPEEQLEEAEERSVLRMYADDETKHAVDNMRYVSSVNARDLDKRKLLGPRRGLTERDREDAYEGLQRSNRFPLPHGHALAPPVRASSRPDLHELFASLERRIATAMGIPHALLVDRRDFAGDPTTHARQFNQTVLNVRAMLEDIAAGIAAIALGNTIEGIEVVISYQPWIPPATVKALRESAGDPLLRDLTLQAIGVAPNFLAERATQLKRSADEPPDGEPPAKRPLREATPIEEEEEEEEQTAPLRGGD